MALTNGNDLEPSFHLRFLGEQVLHSSYSSASYGWLAHKLAAFSEADNAVVVKLEEEGVVLRKLDTSTVITRLPFASNCQSYIHNRELNLFSVVGSDSEAPDLHRLLVFRAASLETIREFSSCLRKAVLATAFNRTNSTKNFKSASHMSNFFEVFYLGRARFSQLTKPLTPEFVDKAVVKLTQEISSAGGGLPNSKTFTCERGGVNKLAENNDALLEGKRPRSNTVANSVDIKDLLSSKCLNPSNPNRTLLVQLTETEVFLISPTAKTILLRIPFSEITAGCQGLGNSQCFAFLTSASESISTTESKKLAVPNKNDGGPLFSPTQTSAVVTTMWAYIFMCSDEHSSSNAILSLRTCIRDPALVTPLKDTTLVVNNTQQKPPPPPPLTKGDVLGMLCDACPVRDFNAICASLIDTASDDDKLTKLDDYVNGPSLTGDDVAFIRQLLPRSAPSVHALICDVVFALFQLAEFNRATHVHLFETASEKLAKQNNQKSQISMTAAKKPAPLEKKMLTSTSFSGPSFVDVIRAKMNLKTKRRGSLANVLFNSGENKEEEELPAEIKVPQFERFHVDLRSLLAPSKKQNGSNSSGDDIFREYIIVSDAELAKLAPPPPPNFADRASSPSFLGRQVSSNLEETPKSAKSGHHLRVPGSEPSHRFASRRCTVDVTNSVVRNTFRTPLARFEQFSSNTPGFGSFSTSVKQTPVVRHPSVAFETPSGQQQQLQQLHPHPQLSTQISVRRRSIFEMVTCSVVTTTTTEKPSLPQPLPQPPTPHFQIDQFPSLIDPESKQLDYEEPLGGCSAETALEWQQIIGLKPEISKQQAKKIEQLLTEGIPKQQRGRIWNWLLKRELCLLSKGNDKIPSVSPQEYADLLSNLTPCNQQILMDLGRTFPNHLYFAQHFGAGQLALFNILKAYSLIDPEVGYCQGISFVAGVLLMHSASEYDAFNLLLGLMFGFGFRTVYLPNMEGLHRCLYQLTRLLDTELPAVFEHMTVNDVMPVFFASPWFVTIFASQFPLGFVVRVFDLVFYGNVEMLFRVIFSLFSINEPLLLSRNGGFEDICEFLKGTFCEMSCIQLERIVAKVFSVNFSVELQRYAIEYDIYREEQDISPVRLVENVALSIVNSSPPGHHNNNTKNNEETCPPLVTRGSVGSDESDSVSSSASTTTGATNSSSSIITSVQRELALSRHKVVELRAERSELLERIEQMTARITSQENEIIRLESLNETLRAENAILRHSSHSKS